MAPAFRVSSNIYFANLAIEIGSPRFRQALSEKMKFRRVPGADAFDADLPDIGYGQGRMLASPLEMARLGCGSRGRRADAAGPVRHQFDRPGESAKRSGRLTPFCSVRRCRRNPRRLSAI